MHLILIYLAGLLSGMVLAVMLIRIILQTNTKKLGKKRHRHVKKQQSERQSREKETDNVFYLSAYRQNDKALE